jgi:HEAT repeat protein
MPRTSLAANLLLSLAVSVLFLGALEGLARLFEPPRPRAALAEGRSWAPEGGAHFYTLEPQPRGWPPSEVTADGVRDRTHTIEKPELSSRVVFLGDSVTEGFGVEPEETYPRVLAARLEEEGERVEVLSVAVRGWSTRQQRIAYHRIARPYRPDVVIVAACLNDIVELEHQLRPPPPFLVGLYGRSALVRRLVGARERELRDVEELFRPGATYDVFFRELSLLREEARRDGADFALVLFPYRLQVSPGAPAPLPQDATAAFCTREGIRYLDLLPAVGTLGPAAFVDDNHLSAEGGRLVATAIERSGLLPRRSFVPLLLDALGAGGPDGAAAKAWIEQGRPRPVPSGTLPALKRALSDASPDVRAAGAWALEAIGAEAAPAAPVLVERLGDPEEPVRAAAARALGSLGPAARGAVPPLLRALDDPREVVRWEATRALARIGVAPGGSLGELTRALGSQDACVRNFAAFTLGEMGSAVGEALDVLVAALEREPGYELGSAARAVRRLGPAIRAAIPGLVGRLGSQDPATRAGAALALAKIGPEAADAVAPLVRSLADADPRVRAHAALALGDIGVDSPGLEPSLLAGLADPEGWVRAEAIRTLGKLGKKGDATVAAVLGALGDADPEVRLQAARALGRIAPASGAVLAGLERATKDADERVRREAGKALEKLRG